MVQLDETIYEKFENKRFNDTRHLDRPYFITHDFLEKEIGILFPADREIIINQTNKYHKKVSLILLSCDKLFECVNEAIQKILGKICKT